jgi:MFS superfamily sulfate permease-like transporter
VVTGFVNALAILIFMAQLPELTNVTWHVYALTAAGLGIIYLFPYLNKTIPSLVCIIVLTAISMWLHLDVRTVGDRQTAGQPAGILILTSRLTWTRCGLFAVFSRACRGGAAGVDDDRNHRGRHDRHAKRQEP